MKQIQRFLGHTEGVAFHEPVFIVYARELSELESELEIATKKVKAAEEMLGFVLDEEGNYDVEASGGPPDPTQPPGTRDYEVSKALRRKK
jgi:hypothetical protein